MTSYDIISRRLRKTIQIRSPIDIVKYLKIYNKSRQELFLIATLDSQHKIIGIHISTVGLVNKTIIHPREAFYHAILDNAVSIIAVHNHPSNAAIPSKEDIGTTDMLVKSGKILGIRLIDHIIITKGGYYSFKENGRLD